MDQPRQILTTSNTCSCKRLWSTRELQDKQELVSLLSLKRTGLPFLGQHTVQLPRKHLIRLRRLHLTRCFWFISLSKHQKISLSKVWVKCQRKVLKNTSAWWHYNFTPTRTAIPYQNVPSKKSKLPWTSPRNNKATAVEKPLGQQWTLPTSRQAILLTSTTSQPTQIPNINLIIIITPIKHNTKPEQTLNEK